MKNIFGIVAILLSFSSIAQADEAESIQKIEIYLNSIKTMEADFIQIASNGASSQGKLFIKKPNKINMEYTDDTNISLIGDGKYVVYHDKDLDQVTHISYKDIPATLILANDIKIDGKKLKAHNFYKDGGITSVTFEYTESDNIGPITLVFNNEPFELKQWKIIDPQGIEISLSLYNIKRDMKLNDSMFRFKDKKFDPLSN
ncbi:MAG: outer membrane lipoprotein carrier protein LolA [Lactobacillaceae bacterium]|jgi:chaperone LolA|nr:outer membrane lipoprotein carrier protein LolA [Lactobacillaceae bacterium]